ncbi:MAG: DinB family protein [Chloroflexota bacterium]
MTAVLDPFVLERAPGPTVELDPALVKARAALNDLLARLARIDDAALTYVWKWDGNDADIRYLFYRALEDIEGASGAAARTMTGTVSSEAHDAVAAATAARWEAQGILATLADADLDADPGGGEWTIRQTLGHIIGGQRGYAWGSAYWISVRNEPKPAGRRRAPDELFAALPEDDDEAIGSLADVRQKLDDIVDATSSRYATLTPDEMMVEGGWSGFPVTIGFRQWRWSSHIQEHTVQVEKTLDMLGRRRTEVQYLIRLIARAYGRLEATAFGFAPGTAAAAIFEDVAGALRALPAGLDEAIAAAVPAEED